MLKTLNIYILNIFQLYFIIQDDAVLNIKIYKKRHVVKYDFNQFYLHKITDKVYFHFAIQIRNVFPHIFILEGGDVADTPLVQVHTLSVARLVFLWSRRIILR